MNIKNNKVLANNSTNSQHRNLYLDKNVFVDLEYSDLEPETSSMIKVASTEKECQNFHEKGDLYCFTISLQKHIADVLSKLDSNTENIKLKFARETSEKNTAYDLSALRRFPKLSLLEIAPEDSIAWSSPVQIKIPSDVISRINTFLSDQIKITIDQSTTEFVKIVS